MLGRARTITGMMKYLIRSGKSVFAWLVLMTGSQPSLTPIQTWSTKASQKLGNANPRNEPIVTVLSIVEYWRVAETMPTGIAIANPRKSAVAWSSTVDQNPSPISAITGLLLKV